MRFNADLCDFWQGKEGARGRPLTISSWQSGPLAAFGRGRPPRYPPLATMPRQVRSLSRPATPPSPPLSRPVTPPSPSLRLQAGPASDPEARRPRSKEIDRDTKIAVRALRRFTPYSRSKIASMMEITCRQVQRACEGPVTPQKSKPKAILKLASSPQKRRLREFLEEDPRHRNIPWSDLRYLVPGFTDWGQYALGQLLTAMGYERRR
jgi:hypothetical protein